MNLKPPSSLALPPAAAGSWPSGRPLAARPSRFRGGQLGHFRSAQGFTLLELMITVSVIGILMAVALPAYQSQVVRTRRASAAGCAMELAQYTERVYASNLRYDQNGGAATVLPATPCRNELAASYSFGFATGQPTQRSFTVVATPLGTQASRDTACGELRIDQANVKSVGGSNAPAQCWR